jgi:ribosomal protein S18 acetylase RimI-like enzyme
MESVRIRPATRDDISRVIELYQELAMTSAPVESGRNPSPEDYGRVLDEIEAMPGHRLLVIEYQGEVAGSVVLLIVPNLSHAGCPWAVMENLIIDHRYRGLGLGRRLVEHVIATAREAGCHKLVLTSDKRRWNAHRFYRDRGFEASAHGFRLYF